MHNVPSSPVVRSSATQKFARSALVDVATAYRDGYVLELYQPGPPARVLEAFVFPLAPQKYTLTEPFVATLTPTEGNSVVAEEYGTILRDISIEGTLGMKPKRGGLGTTDPISGNDHFINLRNFFRLYSRYKQSQSAQERRIEMRWHAVRDDDHFIVVPKMFETPRDIKSTRVHYQYRIQLTAVEKIEASRSTAIEDDENVLQRITRSLNDARGSLVDLTAKTAALRIKLSNVQVVFNNAASVMRAVGGFVRASSDVIYFPWKLAVNTIEQIERTADDLAFDVIDSTAGKYAESIRDFRRMQRSLDRIAQFPDRFVEGFKDTATSEYAGQRKLTQRDFADGTAGASQGSRYSVAYGTEAQAGLDVGSFDNVIRVTVDRTMTLQSLSAKYDVPPEALIILNDLRPPYFTPGGGFGTLAPGDTILIPSGEATGTQPSMLGLAADYDNPDELLYGRDLAIDMDLYRQKSIFDFKLDVAHGSLDAEIVFGIANVEQAMFVLLETEQGTTTFLPDVGLVKRVGRKGTFSNALLASISLREALLSDPRIASIDKMEIFLEKDALYQEVTPRLVDGRVGTTVTQPLGKVQG